jgi:hypothetical protein
MQLLLVGFDEKPSLDVDVTVYILCVHDQLRCKSQQEQAGVIKNNRVSLRPKRWAKSAIDFCVLGSIIRLVEAARC